MKIAIIGTGSVGRALGITWAQKGHAVVWGSRDPHSVKAQGLLAEAGENASASSVEAAVDVAEAVVIAIPWDAARAVVESIGNWEARILIDATNPIAAGLQPAVGKDTSAAEQIASWAPGARVVKAFNTTGAENMADPVYHGESATMFIAGDDADAKSVVTQVAEDLGFDVADVGGLQTARLLEPLALVHVG